MEDRITDAAALEEPASRRAVALRWRDAAGEHRAAVSGEASLGAAAQADVRIDDPTVSRLHARIECQPDGAWIEDLGSKNGTYVDHVRIAHARIPDGAALRLGTVALEVEYSRTARPPEVWPGDRFGELYGASAVMRELFARMAKAAATDSSILIEGETGTGKDGIARAIHAASARGARPFVVVDCAALSESLVQSELFGHAKGAFTGADAERLGAFELADRGTIFLDEVGELSPALQPKLLRVLESRTVVRLGQHQARPLDVRVIAATHRDLRRMVAAGGFREDLYFRLAVVCLKAPPLRQRRVDVGPLFAGFLPEELRRSVPAGLLLAVAQRPLSGNVRELRNLAERYVAFGAEALTGELPPGAPDDGLLLEGPLKAFREQWAELGDRQYLAALLERHGGKVAAASSEAGVDRTYLYRLLRRYGLERE